MEVYFIIHYYDSMWSFFGMEAHLCRFILSFIIMIECGLFFRMEAHLCRFILSFIIMIVCGLFFRMEAHLCRFILEWKHICAGLFYIVSLYLNCWKSN